MGEAEGIQLQRCIPARQPRLNGPLPFSKHRVESIDMANGFRKIRIDPSDCRQNVGVHLFDGLDRFIGDQDAAKDRLVVHDPISQLMHIKQLRVDLVAFKP